MFGLFDQYPYDPAFNHYPHTADHGPTYRIIHIPAAAAMDDLDEGTRVGKPSPPGGAIRFDEGKLRVDLIPPELIKGLAEVYTKGNKKYPDPRNWEKGMAWSRMLAAAKRHLLKWELGEELDDESKLNHLLHVIWNLTALYVYRVRGVGENDIPNVEGGKR